MDETAKTEALPPLPAYFDDCTDRTRNEVQAYARAAIAQDRASRGGDAADGWGAGTEDADGNPLVTVRADELRGLAEFAAGPGLSAWRIDGDMVRREVLATRMQVLAAAALAQQRLERRTYGSQYTPQQREWCEKYERETTFEPLMCDFEAGNETFLAAAKNSRAWFESWAGDAYLRGCDDIPGELEAMYEEITGEKHEAA